MTFKFNCSISTFFADFKVNKFELDLIGNILSLIVMFLPSDISTFFKTVNTLSK